MHKISVFLTLVKVNIGSPKSYYHQK